MLAKCSVFIAMSLDGFIARDDGAVDWLMKANELLPKGEDCGYHSFISSVDAIIMGRHSYEKVMSFEPWPYTNSPVVVLSKNTLNIPKALQSGVSHSAEEPGVLIERLSMLGFKHLYIDGGITIQRFLALGLIDELIITVIPVLLGHGRRLFGDIQQDINLHLMTMQAFECGFVQMRYQVL